MRSHRHNLRPQTEQCHRHSSLLNRSISTHRFQLHYRRRRPRRPAQSHHRSGPSRRSSYIHRYSTHCRRRIIQHHRHDAQVRKHCYNFRCHPHCHHHRLRRLRLRSRHHRQRSYMTLYSHHRCLYCRRRTLHEATLQRHHRKPANRPPAADYTQQTKAIGKHRTIA